MNNISIRYPRGKTLGGSSSINGLLYMRRVTATVNYGDELPLAQGVEFDES